MNTQETISSPVAKVVTAWMAIGITSWADFASFLAACYSAMLICEWVWKRFGRDLAIRAGLLK